MKQVIIVRHGQSKHHTNNMTGGWTDCALTALGKQQAQRTGARLAELLRGDFAFHSSDQTRAAETAEIISLTLRKTPAYDSELRELNNGAAANLTREQAKAVSLPVPADKTQMTDWVPYPNAESWRMMDQRVRAFLEGIRENDTALLITHGNTMVSIVHWWLGLRDSDTMFSAAPCSITMLDMDDFQCRRIHKLNDTAHLACAEA